MSRHQNSGSQPAGNTRAPAKRPGRRTGSERGLDGGRDELRGLRVDDDVPAEQDAADHLPGVRGRVARADGGGGGTGGIGLGHTRTVEETVLARLLDTPALQHFLRRSPDSVAPGPGPAGDHVVNRSICNTPSTRGSAQIAGCMLPTPSGTSAAFGGGADAGAGTTEGAGAPRRGCCAPSWSEGGRRPAPARCRPGSARTAG